MATDKLVKNLIINKMTRAQYQSIEPSDTELYFITDESPIAEIATNEVAGIVKPDGSTIKVTEDGTISSIGGFSGNYNDLTNKPTIPSAYTLPTASTTTLGGVKVDGSTIKIENGIIRVEKAATSIGVATVIEQVSTSSYSYAQYSDGWIEYSGRIEKLQEGNANAVITLPKPLSPYRYYVAGQVIDEIYTPKYQFYLNYWMESAATYQYNVANQSSSTYLGQTSITKVTYAAPVRMTGSNYKWPDGTLPYYKGINWFLNGYALQGA